MGLWSKKKGCRRVNNSASQHNRVKNMVESLNNQEIPTEAAALPGTSEPGDIRMLASEGLTYKLKLLCRTQKEERCKWGSLLHGGPRLYTVTRRL